MTYTVSHLRPCLKVFLLEILGIITVVNHDIQKLLDKEKLN